VAIPVSDLNTLDPALVTQNLAQAAAWAQELNPGLTLKRGPVNDLVTYVHAVLASALQTDLGRYLSAGSLLAVTADPTLADPTVLAALLSNYRVTRNAGVAATGPAVLVVSGAATVTIAAGALFTAGGQTYAATQVYTAKTEAAQLNTASDVLLIPLAGGGYAFTITVVAQTAGAAGNLRKNTVLLPQAPPGGFLSAYAASDFTGGLDAETNTALVNRLLEGVAATAPSNRLNMAAMLRAIPNFAGFTALSIVGYGDPEMLRDQHSILPLSLGGRVDWYVRTALTAVQVGLTVTATLTGVDTDGYALWQFSLGKDVAPGFYEVRDILPAGSNPTLLLNGLPVVADTRALDLTGSGLVPDVVNLVEGAYSRYQAAVITFKDTRAPATQSVGTTASYTLAVVLQPGLDAVQDYLTGRAVRSYGCDVLVRAPVPCFVAVTLTINQQAGGDAPDTIGMAAALAGVINTAPFAGRLFAADLLAAAAPYLNGGRASSLELLGRLRYPDGTQRYLRASDVLAVPDDPGRCVSARTVQFFCDPANVALTVLETIPGP